MEFLVKAREYGTVVIELEGVNELNPETAVQAAEMAELLHFPGAEDFTVYEKGNVARGRVINVRVKRELVASLVR